MSYRVVVTQGAQQDLAKLYAYIAERSGERIADGYLDRIEKYCQSLGSFPERGRRRGDLKNGLRVTGFERRVAIAFQVKRGSGRHRQGALWWPGHRESLQRVVSAKASVG